MNDKLLFWLTGDLLHFCMSYYFQKDFGSEINAIIDIPNKPKRFFEKQKLVKFGKSWYFHDHIKKINKKPDLEYLKKFEKKYDLNLQQLTINERIFYRFNDFYKFSTDEVLGILEQECKLFETVLDEANPRYFLTPLTAFHHQHLF